MTETIESLFEQGVYRYKTGEPINELIPIFKEVCDRAPKSGAAWTCLAWLYLLDNKFISAYKTAQKAVTLNPQEPQARINLAVAMLETNRKGLRQHIELARQLILVDDELDREIKQSIEDGLSRKPNWPSLAKVKRWIYEE